MFKIILSLILSLWLLPAAAETPALAGKSELSLHGGLDYQGPNGDNIDLRIGYGWFLSDDLLVGGEYLWTLMEDIAPGDYRSQQGSAFIEKLFLGEGSLAPYVGGEIGFRNSDFGNYNESGLVLGVRGGARYFLNEAVSIDLSLVYLSSDKDVYIVDFEAEKQYIYPSFGLKAVF